MIEHMLEHMEIAGHTHAHHQEGQEHVHPRDEQEQVHHQDGHEHVHSHGGENHTHGEIPSGHEDMKTNAILFIENVGNLVCPAEFSIGEHIKMLVSTVTEGSDKPYKYPLAFEKADIILLNKVDLIPYLDFDEAYFMKGIRALNKEAPVIKVSGKTGEGFGEVAAWLEERAMELKK